MSQTREPIVVQLDPKWCAQSTRWPCHTVILPLTLRCSLHSALKEFIEPLRTNDHRTDFFAVYRKGSEDFDRDYAKKYDEDLNTSLIFVSRPTSTLHMTPISGVYRLVCSPLSAQHS